MKIKLTDNTDHYNVIYTQVGPYGSSFKEWGLLLYLSQTFKKQTLNNFAL